VSNVFVKLIDVELPITKPGLYSISVDSAFYALGRGMFRMRLYKGDTLVMPCPGLDIPELNGSAHGMWAWFRGGRFRVNAGEEGTYRLRIVPDFRERGVGGQIGLDMPVYAQSFLQPFNPDMDHFKINGVMTEWISRYDHGDMIIPLSFGEAQ
jgi:hypothetical protein